MLRTTASVAAATIAAVALALIAPASASADAVVAESSTTADAQELADSNGPLPIRYATPPTLGPYDWNGPEITNLAITATSDGFTVDFDFASVASPTIPNLFYGGLVTLLVDYGDASTPVRPAPVIGGPPPLYDEPALGLESSSAARQTGHFTQDYRIDRADPLVVALYTATSCDPSSGPVGCGGGDDLFASAVLTPPTGPDRVTGADRYEVAVNVSARAYPSGAYTVFVATGANYPDALSAGPAAAMLNAPLLLTPSDGLPGLVRTEIERLQPGRIVVVGGPNSVSGAVVDDLKSIQANTVRIDGADRFEVSRALSEFAFGPSSQTAYVATGTNFPDALSAGAAAASAYGPVLLVNGGASSLDSATVATLTSLGVKNIVIAGGPNSVSPGIEASLGSVSGVTSVVRDGGTDRYAASAAINTRAFPTAGRAFLATGLKFPDALAGSAWAGAIGAPLYVVTSECVPQATLAAMSAQGVTHVTLLGGPATLTTSVESLTPCA
ncbi:cell wall-binding repeat-containing protein [Herbiconiux moechotypicola]|uniref:Cell wall-binding repeat-containing protein n=1 Tax=Herbiconiux moechotypicola TaxID=637393 RepID=A0ABN3DPV4_9MICO|nr:cell wall-binding repeat-containing protein [Herbiconiux moechotypicola]MCS5731697.1 cell wall-binding repeat-containing protein [Herbiconiux moechotypicola]